MLQLGSAQRDGGSAACYAAQGLAVAEIIGQVFRGPDWPTIRPFVIEDQLCASDAYG
ncbi:MAG: hypothetical protein ACRDRP_12845 [Pseudonocardiaceae bacterium]